MAASLLSFYRVMGLGTGGEIRGKPTSLCMTSPDMEVDAM